MTRPSSSHKYEVFVSHAEEDKHTIAIPLREMLRNAGISAFVDEKDIPPGGVSTAETAYAMANADVAVIVLSPEFVAKKWPMKELLFFLQRRENAQAKGEYLPVIIPVFYRLNVAEMFTEPDLERKTEDGRSLYQVTRFFERRENGEPDANVKAIRSALRAVHGIMGVENHYLASNRESSMPSRQLLLEDVYQTTLQAMPQDARVRSVAFEKHFHTEPLRSVVLDFDGIDVHGEPVTHEGRIKRRILNRHSKSDEIIAIRGNGGVGKSTILKALVNLKELREVFCDGIHLITLGKDATVQTLAHGLARVLHDSGATTAAAKLEKEKDLGVAIREAVRYALWWFHGRSCLFLIDDVWTTRLKMDVFAHVVKLGCADLSSSVVLTTRESEIVSLALNRESIIKVTPRSHQGKESRDMLLLHAGLMDGSANNIRGDDSVMEILAICAGLPVSLAAAGKCVKMMAIDMPSRGGEMWTDYLKILQTCLQQLIRENVGEHANLYATLRASIALLDGLEFEKLGFETPVGFVEMHRRMCVLRRQSKASTCMLQHLWELRNKSEAVVVAKRFAEVGLAEFDKGDVEWAWSDVWRLGVHDSIHDFAISEAERYGDFARAHKVLLDGYSKPERELGSSTYGWKEWLMRHSGEDWYIRRNLDHHLWGAGLREEAKDVEVLVSLYKRLKASVSMEMSVAA